MSNKPYTFWKLFKVQIKTLFCWDLFLSIAFGAGTAYLLPQLILHKKLEAVTGMFLSISSSLLGVVLAGLAIVVVFLNKDYIRILVKKEALFERTLFPFWYTAALAVLASISSIALIAFVDIVCLYLQYVFLFLSSWFSFYTLFATLNLLGTIIGAGSNRALQIKSEIDKNKD